jgi:hypothetical protein
MRAAWRAASMSPTAFSTPGMRLVMASAVSSVLYTSV